MKYFLYAIFIAFLIQGCRCNKINKTAPKNKIQFEYLRFSGFLNWSYILRVDQDGNLSVTEVRQDSNYKSLKILMQKPDIDSLERKLEKLNSKSLKRNYGFGKNTPTDLPVDCIKYTFNATAASTCIYFPEKDEMPAELENLLDFVLSLVKKYDHSEDK